MTRQVRVEHAADGSWRIQLSGRPVEWLSREVAYVLGLNDMPKGRKLAITFATEWIRDAVKRERFVRRSGA